MCEDANTSRSILLRITDGESKVRCQSERYAAEDWVRLRGVKAAKFANELSLDGSIEVPSAEVS